MDTTDGGRTARETPWPRSVRNIVEYVSAFEALDLSYDGLQDIRILGIEEELRELRLRVSKIAPPDGA